MAKPLKPLLTARQQTIPASPAETKHCPVDAFLAAIHLTITENAEMIRTIDETTRRVRLCTGPEKEADSGDPAHGCALEQQLMEIHRILSGQGKWMQQIISEFRI